MTPRLNLEALARLPAAVRRPDYDFLNLGTGIVHLGIGAFHRAHQAVYTEDAMRFGGGDWGILGVSLLHATVPDALAGQAQLYTVEILSDAPRYRVVATIRGSLTATTQGPQVLRAIGSSHTHIVTLTITEKGYCLGTDGELNFEHPEIVHDLNPLSKPHSAIGWLAAGLAARFSTHRRPITIISCDNLQANGAKLRSAVTAFFARTRPQMLGWLREHVTFPGTVVDCIVPATTDSTRARVESALGVRDLACVQREPYSQWVIENHFAGPRPAWDQAGAQIVEDVSAYGRLKLHVLNSCHSALAYLGLPRGYAFVREAIADAELAQFLDELVAAEIAPALVPLPVLDYWRTVRMRFANPRIDHRLSQIAEDGSQKLAERIFPLMIANAQTAAPVKGLARIVRGWLRLMRADVRTALDDAIMLPPSIRSNSTLRAAIAAAAV